MSAKDPWIGRKVGPKNRQYELKQRIGRGGMGHVFLANTTWIDQKVAVKVMSDNFVHLDDFQKRFEREFKLCVGIENDNIVQVRDYGVTEEGYPFYVMEYLQGQTLGDLMREGKIDFPKILSIGIQICKGLEALHEPGIVHRDLKPDNIFITPTPIGDLAKILDLGIAKEIWTTQTQSSSLTQTAMFLGNKHFTSPEQLKSSKNVDARSDIYCLGVILYEMLSGTDPFDLGDGALDGDWDVAHRKQLPKPLNQQPGCENVPSKLITLIDRCLQKEPGNRFASAKELRSILEEIQSSVIRVSSTSPSKTSPASISSSTPTRFQQIPPLSATFKNKPIKILHTKATRILNLCFSPDSQVLASLYATQNRDGKEQFTVETWDLRTEKSLERKIYNDSILAVGFNPQSELIGISSAYKGTVIIFSINTKTIYKHINPQGKIAKAILTANHNFLLASDEGEIYQGNLEDSTQLEYYNFNTGEEPEKIFCVASMPNSQSLLIVTAQNRIYQMIWKNRALRLLENKSSGNWLSGFSISHENFPIRSIAVHPDNQTVVLGNEGKKLRFWNFSERRDACILSSQSHGTTALSFSLEGQLLASAHSDGLIQVWRLSL